MSVQLPDFVTKSFLQQVFQRNFGETLIVKDYKGEWATKKGDNYASEMYRIYVNYEIDDGVTKTKPILLKVLCIGTL